MTSDIEARQQIVPEQRGNDAAQPDPDPSVPEPDVQSAVLRLIDQQQEVTDCELLLAGTVEVLGAGPLSEEELLSRLQVVWPAAGVTAARLATALGVGNRGGLLCRTESLTEPLWTLSDMGWSEVRATASWGEDMYVCAAGQVREKALEAFGQDCGPEQCLLWARAIRRAILAGIRDGERVYAGAVDALDACSLVPQGIDMEAVLAAVGRWSTDPDITAFLNVCVLSALDPSDPFAAELVTNAVTACLLHAAVARRNVAGAAAVLGSVKQQRLVLDTPVLLQMLGSAATAGSVRRVLKAAVDAGFNVVVTEHTLGELSQALQHAESAEASAIQELSSHRVAAEEMGRLVDGEILAIYAAAIAEGRATSWEEFTRLATVALPAELARLDVQQRDHGNYDRDVVRRCEDALSAVLKARGRGRSRANILCDAESMAMVWRKRRRHAKDPSRSAWPGAWLVTSDRAIAPAMQTLSVDDWPYTLTLAQLTLLLTRCQEVPSVRELAEAASTLVAHEAAESIACRYPPLVAIELARAIAGGDEGSEYDLRVAQTISLEDALAEGELRDPAVVTSRVLGARQRRHDDAIRMQRQRLVQSRDRAEDDAKRAQAAAAAERDTTTALIEDLNRERGERLRLEEANAEAAIRRRHDLSRARRAHARDGVIALQVLAAVVGFFTFRPLLATAIVSAPLFWERSRAWVRDSDARLQGLVAAGIAIAPDAVAMLVWLWPRLM